MALHSSNAHFLVSEKDLNSYRFKGPGTKRLHAVFTRPLQCIVTKISATDDNLNWIFPCYNVIEIAKGYAVTL